MRLTVTVDTRIERQKFIDYVVKGFDGRTKREDWSTKDDYWKDYDLYAIKYENKIVGVYSIYKSDYFCNFCILPEYRRKGYGSAALKEIKKYHNFPLTFHLDDMNTKPFYQKTWILLSTPYPDVFTVVENK